MLSRLSTCLLCFAVALSILLSVFVFPSLQVAAQSSGTAWADLPNSTSRDLGKAVTPSSKVSLNDIGSVNIVFAPQNEAAFAALAQAVQDPASPEYRHFISDAEYQQKFAPSQQVIDNFQNYFSSKGLFVAYLSSDHLLMQVQGTINQLDLAFNTVSEYHKNARGDEGYINVAPVRLPSNLASSVKGVVGFDKMHKMSSYASSQKEQPNSDAATPKGSNGGSNTPSTLRTAYDVSNVYTGTGTTVGLTLWGAPNTTDLQNWISAYNLPPLNLVVTPTTAPASNDSLRFEANMDVELVHTIAPGASKRYYIASDASDGSLLTALSYALNDKVNVITNSWGGCERDVDGGTANAYHTIFQEASVQGTTVFFSSGDDGIFSCGTVDGKDTNTPGYASFPSGDDLVTSAGATRLYRDSSTNAWNNETSWSCSTTDGSDDTSCLQKYGGSSGGGITVNYSRPSYQNSITPPSEAKFVYSPTSAKRVEPDISMDGDGNSGIIIYGNYTFGQTNCSNCWLGGGTSAASPELAGVVALATQKHGSNIGGINPYIYAHSNAPWLFDVTSGYNGVNENTGWGYINGLGSLKDVSGFITAITALPSTSLSLNSAPNSSVYGQPVVFTATVTGSSATPTGSVVFTDTTKNVSLGTANLINGSAVITVSSLAAGSHSVTATYSGDTNNQGSAATAPVTQQVNQDSTTTNLSSSNNLIVVGQPLTFTATVSANAPGSGTPSSTVTFTDNISGTLGTGTLNNGVATFSTSNLSVGQHNVTATYSGDANNLISTSSQVAVTVSSSSVATNLALNSAPNPSTVGQSITFTATVSSNSGTPTGSVTFSDSVSGTLGTATLNNGVATISTSSLATGTHVITANYAGNGGYTGSSATLTQTVNPVIVTNTVYTYYLPFVANNSNGFTTYLAFQNVGSATANVNISYFDNTGITVTAATVVTQVAKYGEALPANPFASGASGAGVITSDQPLSVIVPEATPYGGSAYAVNSGSSNNLIAPFALNNAFGDFTTQLNIFNGGNTTATANVTFYGTVGGSSTLVSSTTSVNIAPHKTANLNQNTLASGFSGWAQITGSTSNLVAQVLEQSPNTKFVAIANAVANPSAIEYAPAIFNSGYGSFYTGANVVNPNANPVTVTVTYYDLAANPTPTTPFVIPAYGVASIYNGSSSSGNGLPSGGLPKGFIGTMSVSAVGGNIAMSVNENGGLTALGNSRSGTYAALATGGSTVGLPVVSNGGFTYITGDTILNTSSQPVTATISYYNLDGTAVSGTSKTFTIAGHGSQAYYQGDGSLTSGFYGTAVINETGGPANSLIVTTNAQNVALFYTYSEPNS